MPACIQQAGAFTHAKRKEKSHLEARAYTIWSVQASDGWQRLPVLLAGTDLQAHEATSLGLAIDITWAFTTCMPKRNNRIETIARAVHSTYIREHEKCLLLRYRRLHTAASTAHNARAQCSRTAGATPTSTFTMRPSTAGAITNLPLLLRMQLPALATSFCTLAVDDSAGGRVRGRGGSEWQMLTLGIIWQGGRWDSTAIVDRGV